MTNIFVLSLFVIKTYLINFPVTQYLNSDSSLMQFCPESRPVLGLREADICRINYGQLSILTEMGTLTGPGQSIDQSLDNRKKVIELPEVFQLSQRVKYLQVLDRW